MLSLSPSLQGNVMSDTAVSCIDTHVLSKHGLLWDMYYSSHKKHSPERSDANLIFTQEVSNLKTDYVTM
jgi:hypothetical protein